MPHARLRTALATLAAFAAAALPACGGDPEDPELVRLDDRVFWGRYAIDAEHTEGGIYDDAEHAFYVGSLITGGVYRIDGATGRQTTLFEPAEPGAWWTLGMDLDPAERLLWVCAMDDRRALDEAHDYAGWLWGIDLVTGERVVREALGAAADGGTCTDVAVAADGTVYVNDRQNPRLYRRAPGGPVRLLVEDERLAGGVVGQNALLVTPDQRALLSLIYLPSRLVRVGLPDLEVSEVDIDGDFFDGVPPLSGADGMCHSPDGIHVMFTSQLNHLVPTDASWRAATSTTVDVDGSQTDCVATPAGPYLLNGQAVPFALGQETEPSALLRFDGPL